MDLLRQRNELTPAVGNVRVNARGDELGPGGKIIKNVRKFQETTTKIMPPTQFEESQESPLKNPL